MFAQSLPEGEKVVAGSATFERSADTLTVTTGTPKTIINYDSFNIGQHSTADFRQPSADSITLNRVVGVDPSSIMGTLSSNGRIFLVNPNGILFGRDAHVDVAGLVASTLKIEDADFLNGNYIFSKSGHGAYIVNQGSIKSGSFVTLLAQAVENQGVICAELGKVVLAAGDTMTLALENNNEISVAVDEAVSEEVFGPDGVKMDSAVKNSGTILANKVLMTAKVMNHVFDYAINNTGLVKVSALVNNGGVLELVAQGAPVVNSGTLEAEKTIDINASGSFVNAPTGKIIADAAVSFGNAGSISLEAGTILQQGLISANTQDQGVAGTVTLTSEGDLTLDSGSVTEACALGQSGNGGRVTINSKNGNTFVNKLASIIFSAGKVAGNGGFCEISAFNQLGFYGILNGRAPPGYKTGLTLIDPQYTSISGTFDSNTVIFSPNDIHIAGDITIPVPPSPGGDITGYEYTRLTLLADHTSESVADWDDGVGAIINDGNYSINGNGFESSLTMYAGSGIGTASNPVLTNMNFLSATTQSGNIYVSSSGSYFSPSNVSAPGTVNLSAAGQMTASYISGQTVNLTSGQGMMVSNISGTSVYLTSGAGIYGTANPAVTARDLVMFANGDINGGDAFYTQVSNLLAVDQGSGATINISNSGSNLNILGIANNASEARVDLTNDQDINVLYALLCNGDVNLTSTQGNIYFNTYANISLPEATLTLTANNGEIASKNLENGLVGFWNFDDYSGYFVNDASGNGNYGYTYGNPEAVEGMYGQAIRFNGTNYVAVYDNLGLGSGPFTIIAWYRGTQDSSYVGLLGAVPLPGNTLGYTLEVNNGYLRSWLNGSTFDSSLKVNDGNWHQLVWTRNGATGSLYVDGACDRENYSVPEGSVDSAAAFWIGGWGSTKRLTVGDVDEVRVYNRGLSPLEVGAQYMFAPGNGTISCGNAVLNAKNGIKLDFEGLQTLQAQNSGTGDIQITNKGDFAVGGDGVYNAGGNISISAMSTLTINSAIVSNGGYISLSADEDIILSNGVLVYSENITEGSSAVAGSVSFSAGRDLVLNGGEIYSNAESYADDADATAGSVSLTAGRDMYVYGTRIYSRADAEGTNSAVARAGSVSLNAGRDLAATGDALISSEASANASGLQQGDLYIPAAYVSAYASDVSFSAGGELVVGLTDNGQGTAPVRSLATATGSETMTESLGDIYLNGYSGITLNNRLDGKNFTFTSYGGPLTISLPAEFVLTAAGGMTFNAYGDIDINSSLQAASLSLTSSTGIIVTPAGVNLYATSGDARGDVYLSAGNYLVINGNITCRNLTAYSNNNMTFDAGSTGSFSTSGAVYLQSYNGNVYVANDLNATAFTIYASNMLTTKSLIASNSGDVYLTCYGPVDVEGSINCRNLTVRSWYSDITLNPGTSGSLTTAGYVDLEGDGNVTVNKDLNATDIYIYTYDGTIATKSLTATSGNVYLENYYGPIDVEGGMSAANGYLTAYSYYSGITVNPGTIATLTSFYDAVFSAYSDILINAGISSASGVVSIKSTNGKVTVNPVDTTGSVKAAGYVYIQAAGEIALNCDVTAGGDLTITSLSGSLTSSKFVNLTGQHQYITAADNFVLGSDGGLYLDTTDEIFSGRLNQASGVTGDNWPLGLTLIATGSHTMDIKTALTFAEDLLLNAGGDLTAQGTDYTVSARTIQLGSDNGDLTLPGNLNSTTFIKLSALYGDIVAAGLTAGTNIDVQADGAVGTGKLVATSGYVKVQGASITVSAGANVCSSGTYFTLTSLDGPISVTGSKLTAGGALTLNSDGTLVVNLSDGAYASSISFQSYGDMTVSGVLNSSYSVDLDDEVGNMIVNGDIMALDGYLVLYADGNLTFNGSTASVGSYAGLSAGEDLTLNGTLNVEDNLNVSANNIFVNADQIAAVIDFEAYNNINMAADLYAPSMYLNASYNGGDKSGIWSDGTFTLYGQNIYIRACEDMHINGNQISGGADEFTANLDGGNFGELQSLTVYSVDGGIYVDSAFSRGATGVVTLNCYDDLRINAPIFSDGALINLATFNGSVVVSKLDGSVHISSPAAVTIFTAKGVVAVAQENPLDNPLTVNITGEGTLTLTAGEETNGISGVLSGSTPDGTITLAGTPPGDVYFNGKVLGYVEPAPAPEQPTADTGHIIVSDPKTLTSTELTAHKIISPIGTVYFYHPIAQADMAGAAPFALEAGSYQLSNGELLLVGHKGLLEFFEQLDQKAKQN